MDIVGVLSFALSVVVGLVILVILVVLHELGHALVARRNGVVVEEFGIGFPPVAKAWRVKKSFLGKHVTYSINWLPLGGFVRLQGEHDADDQKGDYGATSLWVKTKILLAGVAANWLVAVVLLSILALFGMPKIIPNQFQIPSDTIVQRQAVLVDSISPNLPAAQMGLRVGDELVSFAGEQLENASILSVLSAQHKGQKISVVFVQDGVQRTADVVLRADNSDGGGYFGVVATQKQPTTYRSTWSAPLVGIGLTGQLTIYTFTSLADTVKTFVTGLINTLSWNSEQRETGRGELSKVGDNVGGPVAILGQMFPQAVQSGLSALLLVSALLSLTLAVMNILPIPALDGGRWFVTVLYRVVLRKPLTKQVEERIHGTGFIILLALVVLVTIADVGKFR